MKKFSIFALAALMVVAFAMPASALENTFGGNNWVSFATVSDMDGNQATPSDDNADIHSRVRLYYTAGIHENLKFVTKFEFDADWGQAGSFGAPGADAVAVEIKNAYFDANFGPVNVKVGTQGSALARGFMWSDDISGIVASFSPNDMVTIPFIYSKFYENGYTAGVNNEENFDVDVYGIAPIFKLGEGISLQPMVVKLASDDASAYGFAAVPANTEVDVLFYGIDASASFGPVSVFALYLQESGDVQTTGAASVDLSGHMFNIGASADLGMFSVRGEFVMMSGDDNAADNDIEAWTSTPRESISYGEILMSNTIFFQHAPGAGLYSDGQTAYDSFAGASNGLTLYTLGASVTPMDKLTLKLDYFDASYAETTVAGASDDIGSEFDLTATYQLMENLDLAVVAAFFQTGEGLAAVNGFTNEEDINMYAAQFTVSW